MLLGMQKWVGIRQGESLLAAGARRRRKQGKKLQLHRPDNKADAEEVEQKLTCRSMMMMKKRSATILDSRKSLA